MSQTLTEKIKDLERQLALKQAYLSVQFSFPKGNKLPDDVRSQVIQELKNACAQLAEDEVPVGQSDAFLHLTQEEIKTLKDLASVAKSRLSKTSTPAPANNVPVKHQVQEEYESVKEAILLTLENVPQSAKIKMGSNEKVFVKSQKDGTAFIVTQSGIGIRVPVEDLDFNL